MATVSVRDATELGAAVRDARLQADISQVDLAADSSVGRQWLVEFEAGSKVSAPFDMVMRVLSVLELRVILDPLVPPPVPRSAQRRVPAASEVLARYSKPGSR